MPKEKYEDRKFRQASLDRIEDANEIIESYLVQGFDLTLRQLYYQFVARALIANSDKEYKRLGDLLRNARLAGLVDWSSIIDRTRTLRGAPHWTSPAEIVRSCSYQFQIDKWSSQPIRPEIWIEKDALVGILSGVCSELDVNYFSCRGYTSSSSMWSAAQRLQRYERSGQDTVIFHLGDHDPSGIDMTRDIQDRLMTFESNVKVHRIALNIQQVEELSPPPNPAKLSDTRAAKYISEYGSESWELDALEPRMISDLIRKHVLSVRDPIMWKQELEIEEAHKRKLKGVAENWDEVSSRF